MHISRLYMLCITIIILYCIINKEYVLVFLCYINCLMHKWDRRGFLLLNFVFSFFFDGEDTEGYIFYHSHCSSSL